MTRILTISSTRRLNNSVNGNPRFMVTFTDGTAAQTNPDSAVNHAVGNTELEGPVVVTFSPKGLITHMVPATDTTKGN